MNRRWILLALVGLLIVEARADDGAIPARIRVEMLVVQVPQDIGLRLRPMLRHENTAGKAVDQIRTMIVDGRATLIASPVVWGGAGQYATAETVEEIRYPSEFDPPTFPGWGFGSFPPPSLEERVRKLIQRLNVPTSFETRNVGVTLEFTANIAPDGAIIADLVPQHTIYEGERRITTRPSEVDRGQYSQPKFRLVKTTTSTRLTPGVWTLVSVSTVPEPETKLEFCVLRATALPE